MNNHIKVSAVLLLFLIGMNVSSISIKADEIKISEEAAYDSTYHI